MIPDKKIYLIRHARSAYNAAQHEVQANFAEKYKQEPKPILEQTPEYLDMKWNGNYVDCDIEEKEGIQQCIECRQKMAKIDVDLVIVSPLRRALTTCALVFKDHKSKAPIIVDPLFREIFESKCDIGSGLRKSMKDNPQFDYSLIENPDYWYIDCINNEKTKTQILQKLSQISSPKELHNHAQQLMLQYLKQLWQNRKSDPKQNPVHKREALSPVQTQKSKLKILLERYNTITVVTHSENIKSYTGVKPPNCSVMVYRPEYFQLDVENVKCQYL